MEKQHEETLRGAAPWPAWVVVTHTRDTFTCEIQTQMQTYPYLTGAYYVHFRFSVLCLNKFAKKQGREVSKGTCTNSHTYSTAEKEI